MIITKSEAVEEAADILDQIEPDWFTKVDVNRLDMDSMGSCVLGQVFSGNAQLLSGYTYATEEFHDLEDLDTFTGVFGGNSDEFGDYTDTWVNYITNRRAIS